MPLALFECTDYTLDLDDVRPGPSPGPARGGVDVEEGVMSRRSLQDEVSGRRLHEVDARSDTESGSARASDQYTGCSLNIYTVS